MSYTVQVEKNLISSCLSNFKGKVLLNSDWIQTLKNLCSNGGIEEECIRPISWKIFWKLYLQILLEIY